MCCGCENVCRVLQLLDVSIVRDQKTGQSQGFAFLTVSIVSIALTFLHVSVVCEYLLYCTKVTLLSTLLIAVHFVLCFNKYTVT